MSVKRKIVDSVVSCLSWAGLPNVLRQFQTDEFCVLMLHGVTEDKFHQHSGIGNTEGIHIHANDLEAICGLLAQNYNVVSLDRAIECLQTRDPLPENTVILTFDDGYLSNYELAFPILEKHGLHGTIFVATDFIENGTWQWWDRLEYALGHSEVSEVRFDFDGLDFSAELETRPDRRAAFVSMLPMIKALPQEIVARTLGKIEERLECSLERCDTPPKMYQPMNWDQVREMEESNTISIGAHTHTHRILGRCQADTIQQELTTCRDLLAERIGVEQPLFSYPNGHIGDHTRNTRRQIIDMGFRCALTTETGFNTIDSDPYTLKRFSTGNSRRYVDVAASGTMNMLLGLNDAIRGRRKRVA